MEKTILFTLVLVSSLALMGAACTKQAPATEQSTTNQPVAAQVTISNFSFQPASLTIKAGETVTWINQDRAPHTVKGAGFSSPTLLQGNSWQYKFDTAGTYNYNCGIHPSMTGQIIVK